MSGSTKTTWPAVGLLLALLLAGGAMGVAADRLWLMQRGRLTPMQLPPQPMLGRPSAEADALLFEELRRALSLTDAQVPAARRIVDKQVADMERFRLRVRPELDSLFEVSRVALDSILTPEQRAQRDALLRQLAPFIDSLGTRPRP